jgi:hypothetical protein
MSSQPHTDEWQTIGTVGTDTAMFAILDPCLGARLAKYWETVYLPSLRDETGAPLERPQFVGAPLRAETYLGDALLFDVEDDGGYDVEARFCDRYGTGRPTLCELRLRLHAHDPGDDEGDELELEE